MSILFGVHVKLQGFCSFKIFQQKSPTRKNTYSQGLSVIVLLLTLFKGMKRHGRCMNVCVIGTNHKATTKKLNALLGCFLHGDFCLHLDYSGDVFITISRWPWLLKLRNHNQELDIAAKNHPSRSKYLHPQQKLIQ